MLDQKTLNVFLDHHGILTVKQAKEAGLGTQTLYKAYSRNDLKRYARGIYYLSDEYFDELYLLQLRFPKGVFSDDAAKFLHGNLKEIPKRISMIFPRGYHLSQANEIGIEAYQMILTPDEIETVLTPRKNPVHVLTENAKIL